MSFATPFFVQFFIHLTHQNSLQKALFFSPAKTPANMLFLPLNRTGYVKDGGTGRSIQYDKSLIDNPNFFSISIVSFFSSGDRADISS